MPFMTVKEFEKRTSVLFAVRGDKLKDIARRLGAYNLAPTLDNLEELRVALKDWKRAHNPAGMRDGWKTDRRNVGKGQGNPIEELDDDVNQQFREESRLALAAAVRALDSAYAVDLDAGYRQNMLDLLHNTVPNNTLPLDCFVWYRSRVLKGQTLWEALIKDFGATDAQGKTDGLTLPRNATQQATMNAGLDTGMATLDCGVVGRYVNRGDEAPRNRVISVSTLSQHTIVHELLHWVTHENFRNYIYSSDMRDHMLGKFIYEGLTEWLTRSGLKEWDQGGYVDLVPIWQSIMDAKTMGVADLKSAFFRGKEIKRVCVELGKITQSNVMYQTVIAEPMRQQLAKMMS